MFKSQPETKPTNPKDALGSTRVPLDIVSAIAIAEESLAMVEGMLKYGKYNFRKIGVRTSIYLGAAMRHIAKYNNGDDRDKKTGVHHLGSARACLGVILDAEAQGKLTDDRPPANPEMSALLDAMEARIKHLQELFKTHSPKHWTIHDSEGHGAMPSEQTVTELQQASKDYTESFKKEFVKLVKERQEKFDRTCLECGQDVRTSCRCYR